MSNILLNWHFLLTVFCFSLQVISIFYSNIDSWSSSIVFITDITFIIITIVNIVSTSTSTVIKIIFITVFIYQSIYSFVYLSINLSIPLFVNLLIIFYHNLPNASSEGRLNETSQICLPTRNNNIKIKLIIKFAYK